MIEKFRKLNKKTCFALLKKHVTISLYKSGSVILNV